MTTLGLAVFAAGALALVVPGCGGGNDGGPPPPKAGPPPANPMAGGVTKQGYDPSGVSNGGTISGTCNWTGATVPTRAPLDVTKDPDTCRHPGALDPSLRVDAASKGVAEVVVFIVKIKQGKAWGPAGVLDNQGCLFLPYVVLHGEGAGALTVTNSDPVNHNTHLFPKKNDPFNQMIGAKGSDSYGAGKGLQAEKMPMKVSCDLHGWMEGWLWVTAHPYHVLTAKNGAYSLTDVPAGTYELGAWHPRTNTIVKGKKVTVAAGGTVTADLAMSDQAALSWK